MHVDASADIAADPLQVEAAAVAAEADGYDSIGAPESKHDVFGALTLAARATSRITLQSAIAVAFAGSRRQDSKAARSSSVITPRRRLANQTAACSSSARCDDVLMACSPRLPAKIW